MAKASTADERLDRLRAAAHEAGIFTDFDGTLSPIVDEPETARPLDGVPALLERLAARYAVVGVLSGRPVAFLERWLPRSLLLSGLYGLEVLDGGVRRDHPSGGMWREVVDDVAAAAGPAGMRVENKGLSITLHYREHPEIEPAVVDFARRQAARSGLALRPARMSIELHPPIAVDKGTALADVTDGLRAVCFLGDDVGDLPAFTALDGLVERGITTLKVAVRSDETPASLLEAADIVVDDPEGARSLLEQLL